MLPDCRSLQIGRRREQHLFAWLHERTKRRLWCTIQEQVQLRGGQIRLFIKHDDVVMELRELHDGLQHVVLRDPPRRVLRL